MGGGKTDAKKARHWQELLGEAARRGMSIREFCRRRRLKESQFYWWQRRLRLSRRKGAGTAAGRCEWAKGELCAGERGSWSDRRWGRVGVERRSATTHYQGS